MDIVEPSTDWIKFDAETDEVPFLHMHDLIEVNYKNGYQSPPVPAWSVDFDGSRYPVTAYRVVKKADVNEIERLRGALALVVTYHEGFTLTIEEVVAAARAALKEEE
jgi:hypothetical protein